MKIKEIMTKDVKTCKIGTDLVEAVSAMRNGDCGILPVVDDAGKVTGVITDRDIALALADKDIPPSKVTAGEVASRHLYYCGPKDDIEDALRIMKKERVRRLPVLDNDGVPVGILSMNDVALHAEKGRKKAVIGFGSVVKTMKAICKHPGSKAIQQQA